MAKYLVTCDIRSMGHSQTAEAKRGYMLSPTTTPKRVPGRSAHSHKQFGILKLFFLTSTNC
eukprot:6050541-Amphidinium_carterae.1